MGKVNEEKIDSALWVVAAGQLAFSSPTKLIDIRSFTGYWEYHLDSAIYTSPPVVNHSGAGLFNLQGDLIGIGSLFMQDVMPPDHPASLAGNMFVPVELLDPIFKEMLTTGMGPNSRRPWLGINAVERQGRLQIVRVTPKSSAQLPGSKPGQMLPGIIGTKGRAVDTFLKKMWGVGGPPVNPPLVAS